MSRRLWVCLNSACTVITYHTSDGICAKCGTAGHLVVVNVERGPP